MNTPLVFPYTAVPGPLPLVRPMMPIQLRNGNRAIAEYALVDSGSDTSVLPYSLGLQLGLSWNQLFALPPASGSFSQTPTRAVFLDAVIANLAPIHLGFSWVQRDDCPLILGQTNFFTLFDVCFFRSQNFFQIQPRTP